MFGNYLRNLIGATAILSFVASTPAQAFWPGQVGKLILPLIKHEKSLPLDEVKRLSELGKKTGGTKEIGKILGEKNLPSVVLEDTYVRIAVHQGKIPEAEARLMMNRLSGTPGFQSTMSKIVGNSDVKTAGHLNELRIADSAVVSGYKVKGVGERFDDGIKNAATDIDVLLEKKGKAIAIEAKDYQASTEIPLDKFRADMDTLVEFAKTNPAGETLKVFTLTNKPADDLAWEILNKEAKRRGVQLIVDVPEGQVIQIDALIRLGL